MLQKIKKNSATIIAILALATAAMDFGKTYLDGHRDWVESNTNITSETLTVLDDRLREVEKESYYLKTIVKEVLLAERGNDTDPENDAFEEPEDLPPSPPMEEGSPPEGELEEAPRQKKYTPHPQIKVPRKKGEKL